MGASAPLTALQEGPQPRDAVGQTESCRADLMIVSGQFSCPPPGSFVAVYGQFLVSAVRSAGASQMRASNGWALGAWESSKPPFPRSVDRTWTGCRIAWAFGHHFRMAGASGPESIDLCLLGVERPDLLYSTPDHQKYPIAGRHPQPYHRVKKQASAGSVCPARMRHNAAKVCGSSSPTSGSSPSLRTPNGQSRPRPPGC